MIEFKAMHHNAIEPERHSHGAAGFDLRCIKSFKIPQRQRVTVDTGVGMEIPDTHVGIIKPRSGLAAMYGLDVLAGIIDSDYRDAIKVLLINHGNKTVHFGVGERIAQMVVVPVMIDSEIVTELNETERGTDGFGSTGQ